MIFSLHFGGSFLAFPHEASSIAGCPSPSCCSPSLPGSRHCRNFFCIAPPHRRLHRHCRCGLPCHGQSTYRRILLDCVAAVFFSGSHWIERRYPLIRSIHRAVLSTRSEIEPSPVGSARLILSSLIHELVDTVAQFVSSVERLDSSSRFSSSVPWLIFFVRPQLSSAARFVG
jgi:hypothetical protein